MPSANCRRVLVGGIYRRNQVLDCVTGSRRVHQIPIDSERQSCGGTTGKQRRAGGQAGTGAGGEAALSAQGGCGGQTRSGARRITLVGEDRRSVIGSSASNTVYFGQN